MIEVHIQFDRRDANLKKITSSYHCWTWTPDYNDSNIKSKQTDGGSGGTVG